MPKLLGLVGDAKMSKSMNNTLPLRAIGDDKALWKLLKGAKTDPAREKREDPGNPDICNIFTMHKELSPEADQAWVRDGCTTAGIGCADCKQKLAANMKLHFADYVERRAQLVAEPARVAAILESGAAKARAIAQQTMADVRGKLGLWRSP